MNMNLPTARYWVTIAVLIPFAYPCPGVEVGVVTLKVPGTADPWLAGMADGSIASACSPALRPDVAPEQNPILVSGIELVAGKQLTFHATGEVSVRGDPIWLSDPQGHMELGVNTRHKEENGLSEIKAPVNALIGVFLGPVSPDVGAPPEGSDFTSAAAREYQVIAPPLKQVFFIGNGQGRDGKPRAVLVPQGATRLFLGVMDECVYWDNKGFFSVIVTTSESGSLIKEPLSALLANKRWSWLTYCLVGLAIGGAAGFGGGYLLAFCFGRSSFRRTQLDYARSRLEKCCPHYSDDRGDTLGLRHAAVSFFLLSEVLQAAGFPKDANGLSAIADEMQGLGALPEAAGPNEQSQRDAVKLQWSERIQNLR